MIHFVTRLPLFAWVGCCLAITVLGLVAYDWSVEEAAWAALDSAGLPAWLIISSIALAWVRNSTFWTWMVLVGFGSGWLWFQVRIKPESSPLP